MVVVMSHVGCGDLCTKSFSIGENSDAPNEVSKDEIRF